MGYPPDSENLHLRERWHRISAERLEPDIRVDRAGGLMTTCVRRPLYRQPAIGLRKGQRCVASQQRDTANGPNLALPSAQQPRQ
jgi:hypothetical protein